ncbi:sigma-70 family RNA polymerase sigma factor [Solibacillus sp. CAU 1738]|uniref:sigma-70 family RNA polymerase sigma factor n=1 Tax=Solibacillus sp. CAU 1738 TaxID=3140363 RepID=UPI003260C2A4
MNFELYYEQYKPLIQKVLYKCKVYGNYDEFRQIAVIALWEAIESFDDKKGSFDSYVYFSMMHKIMKEMERQNKQRERFIITMDDELQFLLESRQLPEIINNITLEILWQKLKIQDRQILYSYYGELMADAEIALQLNMKTDTVKKRRQRLIKKLRDHF